MDDLHVATDVATAGIGAEARAVASKRRARNASRLGIVASCAQGGRTGRCRHDVTIGAFVDDASDESEARSLADWLFHERPRPGRVEMAPPSEEAGTMGAFSDTLQVALGAGGAGSVLAGSVAAWLSTRRSNVKMVLRRADGAEISINAEVKNPEAAIERFLEAGAVAS